MNRIVIALTALLALLLAACGDATPTANTNTPPPLSGANVSIALDWTPNTNHTGLFVALANDYYTAQGINVTILPYADGTTPEQLVTSGKADFAVSFEEQVVVGAAQGQPLVSVAAILQHDTSVLATLKSSGLTRPRDLEGKRYAGFGSTFEEPTLQAMLKADGAPTGTFQNITTNVSGFEAVASKQADFVWIYRGWEAVQAQRQGIDLNLIPFADYGIPDHYTPIIVTSPDTVKNKPDMIRRFLAATAKGYEYAVTNPDDAANLLIRNAPHNSFTDLTVVSQSMHYMAGQYKAGVAHWGVQAAKAWTDYPRFLFGTGKLQDANGKPVTQMPDMSAYWTNAFLPAS